MLTVPWLLFVLVCVHRCVAQSVDQPQMSQSTAPSPACIEFDTTVLREIWSGRQGDAEIALSAALNNRQNGLSKSCDWLILQAMAIAMARSGRFPDAEYYADRSVRKLQETFPPGDRELLIPLHLLSAARIQQGKIAGAREAFREMQQVRQDLPTDRALFHGTAAALLYSEGQYAEAEKEFEITLEAWEESGRGKSVDAASTLHGLADLYINTGRLEKAGQTLDRALAIVASATGAGPLDRIGLLNSRGVLYARRGQWRNAEEDLRAAIALADIQNCLSPAEVELLLLNYARVLRVNHQSQEAGSVEARAAALHAGNIADATVDTSAFLAKPKKK